MTEPLIQHVADTAFLVAEARAQETERPDALFRDPWARALSGEKGRAIAASFPATTAWSVVMRTLIIDAFLEDAIRAGLRTVVNLGAGLDSRPYRMELPADLHWVEVDYPDVIAYKEQCLAGATPRCRLTRERVDLAEDGERRGLLSRLAATNERMVILTEGVVPYLEPDQVAALADDLRVTPQVVGWVVDYISPEIHAYRERSVGPQLAKAQFKFRPTDWFAFFAQHGWGVRDIHYLGDEGQRVGRKAPLPFRARLLMRVLGPLAPPAKRDAFRKSMGYAWLQPQGKSQ